jgi:hypothetical protein
VFRGLKMPKKRKNNIVPTRLTDDELNILDSCGYNSHEIMKMFFEEYTSTTPVGQVIKLKLLKRKKKKLLDKILATYYEIEKIEKNLSNYNALELLPEAIIKLIEVAIKKYLNKNFVYHNISEFLEDNLNNNLVAEHSKRIGYTPEDYKKLVFEYYNEYYD